MKREKHRENDFFPLFGSGEKTQKMENIRKKIHPGPQIFIT